MKIKLHRIHKDEEWKLITCVDGIKYNFVKKYYISNYGHIKNDDFYMNPSIRGKYYRIKLTYIDDDNKHLSKTFAIHRLVCEYFCDPNINNLPTVDHLDGNTFNNHYTNLEWCSYSDQSKRAYNLGLSYVPYGTNCHFSVIDEELVKSICELLSQGYNITDIKQKLNLSNRYDDIITHIRRRDTWKHISKDYNFSTKGKEMGYIPNDIIHKICKMIADGKSYDEIYNKYKKYFDKFLNPKSKFNEIKMKHSCKKISDLYF